MPNCARCGSTLNPDVRFCQSCGTPVAQGQAEDSPDTTPGAESASSPCERCGAVVAAEYTFCPRCGAPRTKAATDKLDAELVAALHDALDEYTRILDYVQSGRIDAAEGQRRAFRTGLIVKDDEAWILDVMSATWFRYDGLRLTLFSQKETDS